MKKVFLINTNIEKAPYPVPPLGLCLIAANIGEGYSVKIYDGVFDEGRNLIPDLLAFEPDYVGFSIRNVDDVVADRHIFYIDKILADFIEPVRKSTSVPVILGGSGFSIFPEELMELTDADFGIIGEGEESFASLLKCLDQGGDLSLIPNLIIAGSAGSRRSFQHIDKSVGRLKFSGIDHFINFSPYKPRGAYSVQTKRGCSHGCIYCTYPLLEGAWFRMRRPADIADEIQQAHDRLGDVMFEFVDSTFNDPEGHAESDLQGDHKEKIKGAYADHGDQPASYQRGTFLSDERSRFHTESMQHLTALLRQY